MRGKAIMMKDLKREMQEVRERWKEQGLDINVFFNEVLMNIESSCELRDGVIE